MALDAFAAAIDNTLPAADEADVPKHEAVAAVERAVDELQDYMHKALTVVEQQMNVLAAKEQARNMEEQKVEMELQLQQDKDDQEIKQAMFEQYKAAMQDKLSQFKTTVEVDKEHEVSLPMVGSDARCLMCGMYQLQCMHMHTTI